MASHRELPSGSRIPPPKLSTRPQTSRPAPIGQPEQADVLTLLGVLLRRWYVILPGFVLAALAGYFVYESVEPIYEADAVYVLAGSEAAPGEAGEEGDGPVDGETAAGPVATSGLAIAAVAESDEVRSALAEQGLTADYTVDYESEGRLFRLEATAPVEEGVVDTANAVIEVIEEEIERRQAALGVDAAERPQLEVLARPTIAVATEEIAPDGTVVTRFVSQGVAAIVDAAPEAQAANPVPANQATAELLATTVGSEVRQTVLQEELGLESQYDIRTNRQDALPFIRISADGTEPVDVLSTLDAVRADMQAELDQRQEAAGVDPAERTELREVAVPMEAEAEAGQAIRPTLTVVGLVIALAVGGAVLLESVSNALARRRDEPVYLQLSFRSSDTEDDDDGRLSSDLDLRT